MIAVDRVGGARRCVPVAEFEYPDDGECETPVVRDDWRPVPLLEKCSRQRFATVPSGDVMTMPLLDKRIEVLSYALREAVERMDFTLIHQLAEKAITTRERIEREQPRRVVHLGRRAFRRDGLCHQARMLADRALTCARGADRARGASRSRRDLD